MGAANEETGESEAVQDRGVAELANGFYEAAIDPTRWTSHFVRLQHVLKSKACAVARYDFERQEGDTCCAVGFGRGYVASDAVSTGSIETWLQRAELDRTPGTILTNKDCIADKDLVRSPFYKKWMKPQGFFHWLCAILEQDGDEVVYFTAYRPNLAGAYTPDEIAFIREFTPNLRQAVRLYLKVKELQAGQHAAMEALNHLPLGVTMVNGQGKLVASNRRAQEIFATSDGMAVVGGEVRTTEPSTTRSLHDLIAQATMHNSAEGTGASHAMSVPRTSGLRPLSVMVSPLTPSEPSNPPDEPIAILFMSDPDHLGEINETWLKELYRLTPTEARLATLIAQGISLAESAELLGIGIGTARNHLKHVFAKTDTRRQAELAHLVAGGTMLFV